MSDRDNVWKRVRVEEPTFLEAYDPTDNYHTVQEIVLGGSMTWGYCNDHYKARPEDRVMDIGANVGIYSAWCASRGAEVDAYECSPAVIPILCKAVEGLNVRVHNCAVRSTGVPIRYAGRREYIGEVPFYNGGVDGSVPWAKAENDMAVEVAAVPFSVALGDFEWDMVKIDIEGGEVDILLNTPVNKLRQIKRAYVELHPWVSERDYLAIVELCSTLWNCTHLCKNIAGRFEALYLAPA